MIAENREDGGRLVRLAWIKWAEQQTAPKPSWLIPWEELSESDKEADRVIWDEITAPYRKGEARMSQQDERDQRIRKNVADLDTLWARMKYLGKTDYKVEWDGDTPMVCWRGQNLGSVASLNDGSMEHLADILDRARKESQKGEKQA